MSKRRLVIAIDCDDVLVPSTEQIVQMYNGRFSTRVTLSNAHSSKNPEWGTDRDTARSRIHDIQLTKEYGETPPFRDAVEVVNKLAKAHDLHLVTARPGHTMPITMVMLEQYFPGAFSEIEHVGLDGNKGAVCQRLAADFLIDDNLKHLVTAKECGTENLIWFGDYVWQQTKELDALSSEVVRCLNWNEVEKEIDRVIKY